MSGKEIIMLKENQDVSALCLETKDRSWVQLHRWMVKESGNDELLIVNLAHTGAWFRKNTGIT